MGNLKEEINERLEYANTRIAEESQHYDENMALVQYWCGQRDALEGLLEAVEVGEING